MDYGNYFEFRQIDPTDYGGFVLPAYLKDALGTPAGKRILDFGCGFGQVSSALRDAGYAVEGLDISPPAIAHCRSIGLLCHEGSEEGFYEKHAGLFDYVVMSHVVEHFPKDDIIPMLKKVHGLVRPGGGAIIMVPNAQSNTGAYWAYEDFTHYTLFTSGSLFYVLRAAGFSTVQLLDIDCTAGLAPHKKFIKKALLSLYRLNYKFWNRITGSAIHQPSPFVFSYEVKALAKR